MKTALLIFALAMSATALILAFRSAIASVFNNFTGIAGSTNTESYVKQIERHAFDNFDPDNFDPDNFDPDNFDPDNFDEGDNAGGKMARQMGYKPFTVKPGGNFGIKIVNGWQSGDTASGAAIVELFNLGRSAAFVNNPAVFQSTSAVVPATVDKIITFVAATDLDGYTYFDNSGNLIIQNSAGRKITISCQQTPYFFLLMGTATNAFIFKSIKLSYANDSTLDNAITHTTYTFLGSSKTNEITPRDYFRDTQFQSKIVTVPLKGIIGRDNGLTLPVNNAETISLLFTLQAYVKTGL